jgi:hypothetical protein
MKSNVLSLSTFLAAVAAIVLLPMSAAAAGVAFTVTGVLAVLVGDYGRPLQPVAPRAEVVPFPAANLSAGLRRAA